jgi:FKBP-type peptidyl-prolyl cis-trans isomerase 2
MKMPQAKTGDTVRIHYTGKLNDGTVFDSSRQREPMELKLGGGQVIPGFERAVEGMAPGDSKRVQVTAADAYGHRQDAQVLEFRRSELPPNAPPKVGQRIELQTEGGQKVPAQITNVTEATFTVDANHPLAGKDLTFDLELVDIV